MYESSHGMELLPRDVQDEQDLLANYHAQRAELERVVGGPLPVAAESDPSRMQMPRRLEGR